MLSLYVRPALALVAASVHACWHVHVESDWDPEIVSSSADFVRALAEAICYSAHLSSSSADVFGPDPMRDLLPPRGCNPRFYLGGELNHTL